MELTKQVESEYVDEILEGLQKYWNYRANSYSKSNIEELNNFKRDAWLKILLENAPKKEKLRVLDMGAGPGFFSILMSLAGNEVTAVDVTEEMLENAKHNAKHFDLDMNFVQIDGVNLPFEDNSFDFIISRNVVWNLEYPKEVFKEWKRLLDKEWRVVYFDANWYCHLSDETKKREFALTRENLKREGIYDYFVDGEGIDNDWMDDIARQMPLTYIVRPTWDICKLKDIGFREATAETEKVFEVLTPEEKENYKNSPMFMIEAVK